MPGRQSPVKRGAGGGADGGGADGGGADGGGADGGGADGGGAGGRCRGRCRRGRCRNSGPEPGTVVKPAPRVARIRRQAARAGRTQPPITHLSTRL
jgi:hypothetical protein